MTEFVLDPYQIKGMDGLAQSETRMLAWEAGSGKTPPTVRAWSKVRARRVLVACPPIALYVWRDHARDWGEFDDIRVFNGIPSRDFVSGEGVRVVSYAQLVASPELAEALVAERWDVLTLDEAHYLKTPDAQRTVQVYGVATDRRDGLASAASRVWCLSGTPLLNHAGEFWTHLRALAPETIAYQGARVMDERMFLERFCFLRETPFGPRVVGSRNTEELRERVRPFIDRKRKRDVLPELPETRVSEHPINDRRLARELNLTLARHGAVVGEIMNAQDDDEVLEALERNQVCLATVRRLVGSAKVEAVVELVQDELEAESLRKVIVFAYHREVVTALTHKLAKYGAMNIDGGTPRRYAKEREDRFQREPDKRVIVLQIDAASEAITLNASNTVIFAEASWTPERNNQAIARAHRRGQKNAVTARFTVMLGTIDETIMRVLARKAREIASVIDGAPAPRQPVLVFPED